MEVQRTHNVTLASGAQRRDSTALPHAVLTGSIAAICPYTALLPAEYPALCSPSPCDPGNVDSRQIRAYFHRYNEYVYTIILKIKQE